MTQMRISRSPSQQRSLPPLLYPPLQPPFFPGGASTISAKTFGATARNSIIAPTTSVTITAGDPDVLSCDHVLESIARCKRPRSTKKSTSLPLAATPSTLHHPACRLQRGTHIIISPRTVLLEHVQADDPPQAATHRKRLTAHHYPQSSH